MVTGISGRRLRGGLSDVRASMGSGRGDRNQRAEMPEDDAELRLQWGPVVVTGISRAMEYLERGESLAASMGSGRGDRNQEIWLRGSA